MKNYTSIEIANSIFKQKIQLKLRIGIDKKIINFFRSLLIIIQKYVKH